MKKAALHSLGCKVNSYETEAMQQLLEEAGYEIVPFHTCADLYVINTCSVTNVADKKSRQMIHRARKMNPDAIVVAAGCYVQTSAEEAHTDACIDIILGNNKKKDLLTAIQEFEASKVDACMIDINDGAQLYEELKLDHPKEHTRAFLKVQDGCNQFCSYCIIPYARGRVRSRNLDDVVAETKNLAANGFREIVLTGIHLSSYGVDNGSSLLDLIRAVHAVDGIARIRLGSLEPRLITRSFVEALIQLPKVCPHFHLSLQSGSDTVLKRMNRKYTTADYLEGCNILREYYEHPAITTDIIVGFPGETAAEFAETMEFVKTVRFYEIHVFKYSRRQGTVADRMENQIPESMKAERSKLLMEQADALKGEYIGWYTGKMVQVLCEEEHEKDGMTGFTGFTPEYVKVFVPSHENLRNQMREVEFSGEIY